MKNLIVLGTVAFTSICADYHDPVVSLHTDVSNLTGWPEFHASVNHQSTFTFEDNTAIILHGLLNPYSHKTFHNELGVGFRRMYENFGFGTNIVYAHRNTFGFFNHHLVPGIELFYKHFTLTYNRYLPVISRVQIQDLTYLFHDVSEISLSYRPSKKYEFSFSPYINHQTKQVGLRGAISAFVYDNFELSVTPYFESGVKKGVEFALAYHFAGPGKKINRKLAKSHRFFYTSDQKQIAKYPEPSASVLVPAPSPIVISPAPIQEDKPKDVKSWWDYVSSWRASNQAASK